MQTALDMFMHCAAVLMVGAVIMGKGTTRPPAQGDSLAAAAALQLEALAARDDVVACGRLVLVDESSGELATLAQHHEGWLRALASPTVRRLAIVGFPGSGKTTCIALAIAWMILRAAAGHPPVSIIYATSSENVGKRLARLVRSIIGLAIQAGVFPEAAGRLRWTGDTCDLEGSTTRNSLFRIAGPNTRLLSLRGSLLIADDAEDAREARFGSRDARERRRAWFNEVLGTRAIDASTRIVIAGAPFDEADLLSETSRKAGWVSMPVRALDEHGQPTWPQRWPLEALMRVRADLGESVWRRSYLLDASSGDGRALFSPYAIERALMLGRGTPSGDAWWIDPENPIEVIGVDPAFTTHATGDRTGIVVATTAPDGRKVVVDALELRLGPAELTREIIRLAIRWRPRFVTIESNGAQRALTAMVRAAAPRLDVLDRVTTSKSKWDEHEGLPGLSACFEREWALPCDMDLEPSPSSRLMIAALKASKASVEDHQPDLVMALGLCHRTMPGQMDTSALSNWLNR